ncbi:hypothetical protein LX32DRAFT_358085 [Colletotrichum zoysiae]|uniref:Uncharacterized protein n=1 Tax=Colletotrichum zoysiae TaxID=1216348 RepID=A0AAD9HIE9_9PEZI|nr:hypothetical protein LX32DRAFT_358085 [Colletotrichum zoysiae]
MMTGKVKRTSFSLVSYVLIAFFFRFLISYHLSPLLYKKIGLPPLLIVFLVLVFLSPFSPPTTNGYATSPVPLKSRAQVLNTMLDKYGTPVETERVKMNWCLDLQGCDHATTSDGQPNLFPCAETR